MAGLPLSLSNRLQFPDMCGRGGLNYNWADVWQFLSLPDNPPDGGVRILNLSPSRRQGGEVHWSRVPVVRNTPRGRVLDELVWPLVPPWLRGQLPKFSTANCRSESDRPFADVVAGKPAFRNAWKKQRRCLVPFSHFFEWDQRTRPKQPWRVEAAHTPVLPLAGLWEQSPGPNGSPLESFTLITTSPNRLLKAIGHHRSPVVIDREDHEQWLAGTDEEAQALLVPPPDDFLRAWKVTTRVNNPGYQEPDLLQTTEPREV